MNEKLHQNKDKFKEDILSRILMKKHDVIVVEALYDLKVYKILNST